jgi:Mitochondrial K+-H+ exchange-related
MVGPTQPRFVRAMKLEGDLPRLPLIRLGEMRIFFLPLTVRQTLICAQRIEASSGENMTIMQKLEHRAHQTWVKWGHSKSKWLSKPVAIGNDLLDRIDWEEYCLKSFHDPKILKAEKVRLVDIWLTCRFASCIQLGLRPIISVRALSS